jgi:hypothetical protein
MRRVSRHTKHNNIVLFAIEVKGWGNMVLAFAALSLGGKNLSISEGLISVRTKGFPFIQTY